MQSLSLYYEALTQRFNQMINKTVWINGKWQVYFKRCEGKNNKNRKEARKDEDEWPTTKGRVWGSPLIVLRVDTRIPWSGVATRAAAVAPSVTSTVSPIVTASITRRATSRGAFTGPIISWPFWASLSTTLPVLSFSLSLTVLTLPLALSFSILSSGFSVPFPSSFFHFNLLMTIKMSNKLVSRKLDQNLRPEVRLIFRGSWWSLDGAFPRNDLPDDDRYREYLNRRSRLHRHAIFAAGMTRLAWHCGTLAQQTLSSSGIPPPAVNGRKTVTN